MSFENDQVTVYLGLGSNIGASAETVREAFNRLSEVLEGARLSGLYTTEPQDVKNQPDFINAACCGRFSGDGPYKLLSFIHRIEADLGRDRSKETRRGPRTIDIDILLFGRLILNDTSPGKPFLIIPHERIRERKFALVPLLELEPSLTDPLSGKPFMSFLDNLDDQAVLPFSDA